jgi:DNA repair photolyase
MNLKRQLFSSKEKCLNGCLYCFSKWDTFEKQDLFDIEEIKSESKVIYPCCDSELILNANTIDKMFEIAKIRNATTIFSIATKNSIPIEVLELLSITNQRLIDQNLGFIKISVSFSNKSLIGKIEKGTASYSERIDLLENINQKNIPSSVILKPILPFIDTQEYIDIVTDALMFTKCYLLGDLYINTQSNFYKEYLEGRYSHLEREVSWLKRKTRWNVVEDISKKEIIQNHIEALGGKFFDSDIEFLEYINKQLSLVMK